MDPRPAQLRQRLFDLGFDEVRFAATQPGLRATLREWLAAGLHADMHWMERTADKRDNPDLVLSGTRSIIMLGVSYWSERLRHRQGDRPAWARYALHEDYHDTIKPGLVAAGKALAEIYGQTETDYRYYVDTGPVLERGWAERAGLGFVGKNAMLISRTHGNWLFLAAILTRAEIVPDSPIPRTLQQRDVGLLCGKCTRCLDACPTNAFAAPGVVDARRCISYQTIENKGAIPRDLRAGIGTRIYGCDVCLEVCPWNRFAAEGRKFLLAARHDVGELGLNEILALTPERFAVIFRGTAVKRLKLVGLLRNACVVAGNSRDAQFVPALGRLAGEHPSPLVRQHAVWALQQLGAETALRALRARETDAAVLLEYDPPLERPLP